MALSKFLKRKKCLPTFRDDWLKELVETEVPNRRGSMRVQLSEIYTFDPDIGVVCLFCQKAKVKGEFSSGKNWDDGWKLDYLKRHLTNKSHLSGVKLLQNQNPSLGLGLIGMLLETPDEKQKRQSDLERKRSKPDEIKILIDNVLLAVKMNSSMLSVEKINEHMEKYVSMPASWRSKNYAFEFLEVINSVIETEVMAEIASSTFHTLTVDESTDISVNKFLILYFKYRPASSSEYKTTFGGLLQLKSCDAATIVAAIKEFYKIHKLDLMKMVMFTSDGASVMLGKRNGVAAQLKLEIPHLVEQHCVAHSEDLGISDAWKDIKLMRDIETLIRTVYTVFCRSSSKKCKFQDIADASECDSVAFRPLNEIRWLSRHFAVAALVRNYDPLIEYFEQEKINDPIAKYCLKKLNSPENRITLEILNDVLGELASLTMSFQKSCLTSIEAYHLAQGKINKIRKQYLSNVTFWNTKVVKLLDQCKERDIEVNTGFIIAFIKSVCEHLENRFPEGEINNWSAFDCTALTECTFDFGVQEITALCTKYKDLIGENFDDVVSEYNDYKFTVGELIKGRLVSNYQDMIQFAFKNEQFGKLSKLMDVAGTFLASSVDCERGFSLMNALKTKQRNRLEESHLEMLMRTKSFQSGGGLINLDNIYSEWAGTKDRREKL